MLKNLKAVDGSASVKNLLTSQSRTSQNKMRFVELGILAQQLHNTTCKIAINARLL